MQWRANALLQYQAHLLRWYPHRIQPKAQPPLPKHDVTAAARLNKQTPAKSSTTSTTNNCYTLGAAAASAPAICIDDVPNMTPTASSAHTNCQANPTTAPHKIGSCRLQHAPILKHTRACLNSKKYTKTWTKHMIAHSACSALLSRTTHTVHSSSFPTCCLLHHFILHSCRASLRQSSSNLCTGLCVLTPSRM
jgi:hypothetical protein